MEWDPKISAWDLEELVEQNVMDCSVDLKLGGLGDLVPSEKRNIDQPRMSPAMVTASSASSSSPSKRARQLSNASQNVSCLVDGCDSDLTDCKEYHRRHKVCELHSKTAVVRVGGQEQRFCQQCSRFHLLIEFDEVKRSCRKRLDGHNRRRRKPQPEPLNAGSLFLNFQESRFSTFPPMLPTPPAEPNWFGTKMAEEDATLTFQSPLNIIHSQTHLHGSISQNYRERKEFPYLKDGDTAFSSLTMEPLTCQPWLMTRSSAETSSCKMLSEGLPQVLDSNCAHSLLSSPSQTSVVSMEQPLLDKRIPMALPLISSLQYGSLSLHSTSQTSISISSTEFSGSGISDAHADAGADHLHCQGVFHVGSEGSSHGTSHSLPFTWQ